MMIKTKLINVSLSTKEKKKFLLKYEEDVSIGELIRNCCVNLGLQDFDTINGITINVTVFIKNNLKYEKLDYNPYSSLKELLKLFNIDSLELLINPNE